MCSEIVKKGASSTAPLRDFIRPGRTTEPFILSSVAQAIAEQRSWSTHIEGR